MFGISSDNNRFKSVFERYEGDVLSPSYLNALDNSIVDVSGKLVLGYGDSGLGDLLGSRNSIIYADSVSGPYFMNRLVSGLVEVGNQKNKRKKPKTSNAFSQQVGGTVVFGSLAGDYIGRDRYGGVLEGQRIDGNHFGLDMKGGVTVLKSVNGAYPFKNMDGGIVVVDRCKSENPFYGMKSGIAIVGSFESKKEPRFFERDGGTIITTEKSLTGDETVDNYILENAVVFSGTNASRKLKAFAALTLGFTYPWLVEKCNGIVYSSVLESFRNSEGQSSDSYGDSFDECLEWIVPVDAGDDATILDVEKKRKELYTMSMLKSVSEKITDLRDIRYAPDFYKSNRSKDRDALLKKLQESARRIYFFDHFVDMFSAEPVSAGKIEVDRRKDWDIVKQVFGIKGK